MSVDWSKPVRAIGARFEILSVLSTDVDDSEYPVLLHVRYPGGARGVCWCSKDGRTLSGGQVIENVPPKRGVWFNVYRSGLGDRYLTREQADRCGDGRSDRIHLLELDIDTGECIRHEVTT